MATQKLVSQISPQQQPAGGQQAPRMTPYDISAFDDTVGASIELVRKEVDDAFEDMKTFSHSEPDEIMRICGGQSARLSEIRVRIMRIEDFKREWRNVRLREIEPALEELEKQYTIASRLHSVRELDWKMESGER